MREAILIYIEKSAINTQHQPQISLPTRRHRQLASYLISDPGAGAGVLCIETQA